MKTGCLHSLAIALVASFGVVVFNSRAPLPHAVNPPALPQPSSAADDTPPRVKSSSNVDAVVAKLELVPDLPVAARPSMNEPANSYFVQMANATEPLLWSDRLKFEQVLAATKAKDAVLLRSLRNGSGVTSVRGGTLARSTMKIDGGRQVTIDDGSLQGRAGWIEDRYLRAAPDPGLAAVAKEERATEVVRRRERQARLTQQAEKGGGDVGLFGNMGSMGGFSGMGLPGGSAGSSLCGAMTRAGLPCRNPVSGGGHCYLH